MKDKRFIKKIYSDRMYNSVSDKISKLGNSFKMDTYQYLNTKFMIMIVVSVILLLSFKLGYLYAICFFIIFNYLFDYLVLSRQIEKRSKALDKEAVMFFEVLSLTLESGRNLERAIRVSCDNLDGELSGEFKRALNEINFGKSLMEVLTDMKSRIPSETINNIIRSITQTNIFGNSILETLHRQVDYLRNKNLLRVQEEINKLPIKISIISVLFVVPLILLLVLGPFIIEILA